MPKCFSDSPNEFPIVSRNVFTSWGLGFNIVGGTDLPHHQGDSGIFVSKIKRGGAAQVDGTLQVWDRIIEVVLNVLQTLFLVIFVKLLYNNLVANI